MKSIEDFYGMGNPRRNGLGFVWLMETPRIRWNFYHPDLVPQKVDNYHNHQRSFVSTIYKGRFCNQRAKLIEGNKQIKTIDCVENNSTGFNSTVWKDNVGIKKLEVERYISGDSYSMAANEYHIAWAEAPTITRLEVCGNENEPGLAVYDKEEELICPIKDFRYPHSLCWEIIETVIND